MQLEQYDSKYLLFMEDVIKSCEKLESMLEGTRKNDSKKIINDEKSI